MLWIRGRLRRRVGRCIPKRAGYRSTLSARLCLPTLRLALPPDEGQVERIAREYFDYEIGGTPEEHKEGPDGWQTDDWMDAVKDQIRFILSHASSPPKEGEER